MALFEVLAGETFGHLNYSLYQHNGELDTKSSKKSNAQGFSWREGDTGSFIIKGLENSGLRNRGEMTSYTSKYTQPVQWTKSIIINTL